MVLDCRKFRKQVIATIGKLKSDFEAYLIKQFKSILDVQVEKNHAVWNKVVCVHEDIDEIICQIDLISSLHDEEIFEDMRTAIMKIGQKKFFLDSLKIAVSEIDFQNFMSLYSFPNELKAALGEKKFDLQAEQKVINEKINIAASVIKKSVVKFTFDFMQFQSVGLPTRQDLIDSITEDTKE